MQFDRKQIESALRKKGFVEESSSHHKYFYHEVAGKRTGVHTYTSHGSKYKTYGDSLLSAMKKQLKLDSSSEFKDLVECPMDGEKYSSILKSKGVF